MDGTRTCLQTEHCWRRDCEATKAHLQQMLTLASGLCWKVYTTPAGCSCRVWGSVTRRSYWLLIVASTGQHFKEWKVLIIWVGWARWVALFPAEPLTCVGVWRDNEAQHSERAAEANARHNLLTLGRVEGLSETSTALIFWPSESCPSTSTMWSSSFVLGPMQACRGQENRDAAFKPDPFSSVQTGSWVFVT